MTKVRLSIWEGRRWAFPPAILAIIAATVFFYLMDMVSSDLFLLEWRGENLTGSAYKYFNYCLLKVSNVGLCLVVLLGAGLYAQDYESGAVYARVQRLGAGKYAGLRTMQTALSAFVSGSVAILLLFPLFAFIFKIPIFSSWDVDEYSTPLLAGGHTVQWFIALSILAGLQSVFYALLTLLVSLFIPKKKVLIAVPYVLCYFFNHVISRISWIPSWMQPFYIFNMQFGAMNTTYINLKMMSEWCFLGVAAGVTLILYTVVWLLLYQHIKRNGIFGGEQSE